jgi:hypothetical protein
MSRLPVGTYLGRGTLNLHPPVLNRPPGKYNLPSVGKEERKKERKKTAFCSFSVIVVVVVFLSRGSSGVR